MKQTLFLLLMMFYFTCRSFVEPFWAVFLYYGLSVLRPQALWEWALPEGIRWSLYAAVLAVVVAILHGRPVQRRATRPLFLPMLAVFAFCLLCSYHHALDRTLASATGWEYAKLLTMLVVGAWVLTERRHLRYLAWMIFACLGYVVYEMNSLYFFKGMLYIYHHGFGGYDNNGAALALAMVIPFGYFFWLAERRWWRWGYLAVTLPAMHVVMLSLSRGAMLSTLVVMVGMLAATARRHAGRTLLAAILLTAAIAVLAGPEVRDRFATIGDKLQDPSAESRYLSWRAGYRIAKAYPLFGVGLRNSNLLTWDYGADRAGRTIHNNYLQIAADAGLPALTVFVSLLVASFGWFHLGAQRAAADMDDPEMRWHHYICRAGGWSLATFAVGSVFLSFETFELPYLLMLMAAAAPDLAGEPRLAIADSQPRRLPRVAALSPAETPA
ncbi:MAG: hypothetical protein GXY33_22280 [Phycisphaerae bacterium]|nr:hypothetical protein [Phycisphaerae bacterium]